MQKSIIERNIVVLLFVAVLITFSFAQRDSKKLDRLYSGAEKAKMQLLAKMQEKGIHHPY